MFYNNSKTYFAFKLKKKLTLILVLILSAIVQNIHSQSFEVEFDTTSYLQVEPFDRSCLVWATITSTSNSVEKLIIYAEVDPPKGWSFHTPYYLYLDPGEVQRPLMLTAMNVGGPNQILVHFKICTESDTNSVIEKTIEINHAGRNPRGGGINDNFVVCVNVHDKETAEPLPNAHVYLWQGGRPEYTHSNESGRFDIFTMPYDTMKYYADLYNIPWEGYLLEVHCAGYQSLYLDSLKSNNGPDRIDLDVSMSRLDKTATYQSKWIYPLDHPGVWYVIPTEDYSKIAVSMAKHPDPWDTPPYPTYVHMFDISGTLLWSYPVDDETWGMDMLKDGSLIAAGTNGSNLYVIDETGNLKWKFTPDNPGEIREVRFSHNGEYVCCETNPFKLFNANTGEVLWECSLIPTHWRGIGFSPNDDYVAFGGGESLILVDIEGNLVWEKYIGGTLPYFIGMTPTLSRIVVADKVDLLSCFDKAGNLLWRHHMNVLTDAYMNKDGTRIVAFTHDGIVWMYDENGELLWRRAVDGAGHNGIHITEDGKYTIVGGETRDTPYKTMLLDENGNLLWEHYEPGPVPDPYHPYLMSTMCVHISNDLKYIISGYGTGQPGIQVFEGGVVSAINEKHSLNSIRSYKLGQNYPNPFNSKTKIEYIIPDGGPVVIEIFNITGRKITTL